MANRILMLCADQDVVDAGVSWRVHFHGLYQFDDGHYEWHTFGSPSQAIPSLPPQYGTPQIFTHTYVVFPSGFNDLSQDEGKGLIAELGWLSGEGRENIE